ncbi:hypothetical protein E2C01_032571 [Portunus trituberculatus]|uniref:Uncharacterized protein n=1 Tax=Portunus trituberculatus TaxID=210409 RepID=A0A5B7EXV6_PORTR|nr:hypothetical protein [Portunus trituberculatus]
MLINAPELRPIAPVGTLEQCMGSAVQLLPITGAGNFIYSGTHIRAHITPEAHLGCNHLEPGYHGDIRPPLSPDIATRASQAKREGRKEGKASEGGDKYSSGLGPSHLHGTREQCPSCCLIPPLPPPPPPSPPPPPPSPLPPPLPPPRAQPHTINGFLLRRRIEGWSLSGCCAGGGGSGNGGSSGRR